jgi:protein TonB
MKPNYTVPFSFVLVVIAHLGVLAAIIYAPKNLAPITIEPPTIQGTIVTSEPPQSTPPPPPPEQKPLPTPEAPTIPLPKAPKSERAPVVEQQSPPQEKPIEQPTTPAEPSNAPVVPPQADASQFNNPAPVYPQQSRRLRETGVVILEVLVKADGSLGDMRLKTSSGYSRLDEAAQKAVKSWRFVPAKRGNEAIDFWYELPIEFSLNR